MLRNASSNGRRGRLVGKDVPGIFNQGSKTPLLVSSIWGIRREMFTGYIFAAEPLEYENVNKLCTSDSKIRKIRLGTLVCVLNAIFSTWTFESMAYRYIRSHRLLPGISTSEISNLVTQGLETETSKITKTLKEELHPV